jgi:hypothetical protein
MAIMKEVTVEEYDKFKLWYLKYTNKRVLKTKSGPSSRTVLDKETKTTVCSESHRLGVSKYRINPEYYEKYANVAFGEEI